MQLTREGFKANLVKVLTNAGYLELEEKFSFFITPVIEHNVTYNSLDDIMRLWFLTDDNILGRRFTVEEVVRFLGQPNQKYPLWIKVKFDKTESDINVLN